MTEKFNKTKVREIVDFSLIHGDQAAMDTFHAAPESLSRYKRKYKELFGADIIDRQAAINRIMGHYSDAELQAIAEGKRIAPGHDWTHTTFDGDKITFGFFTDTHIGSIYFNEDYFKRALDECTAAGCAFIAHAGDVTEGMSNRPGHYYELTHIGYERQRDYAVEIMSQWPNKWYMISGNHDRWYIKSNGANIVKDIAAAVPDGEFLGHDEGDVIINKNIIIKLFHGEDGSSYAHSYRPQKIVESFTGGEKPHVLLTGHVHKSIYIFERHVHVISGGALSRQSKWMRGKRLPNHYGFWIVNMHIGGGSVRRFQAEFFPFYS